MMSALVLSGSSSELFANGIERNGIGARSMALGGASVADGGDALIATVVNPALLGFFESSRLQIGAAGAFADGDYHAPNGGSGDLDDSWGVMPELAYVVPLSPQFVLGLSVSADNSRIADWDYPDPVGAAGASYGQQAHRSEILNVRTAASIGYKVSNSVTLGASAGAIYTRNELHVPYIFQSHPALKGAKTLFDMETDGWGFAADAGLAWKVNESVTAGVMYRAPVKFETEGDAHGDATRQLKALGFAGVDGSFEYDSDVDTELPQKVAAGLAVKATDKLRFYGQAEWINWSDAYDDLTVRLTRGTNGAINGVLGSDDLTDVIPLKWEDTWVFRLGAEYDVTPNFSLRAGYAYGRSPVPDSTVLPMTAAITEHTISAGAGWHDGPWSVDFAWQFDLPASQTAGTNVIAGTEYDRSKVDLSAHWFGLTVGYSF